ncbi:translational GTPase TypA [Polaribacter aquimarinus]|mgnify:FL=1|uniref:Large ribosomal subunit assembly factor BipA n=1 Tax=Polaribacter aquimarinus TaxID=2100726 RepID=A0A2U2J9M1_9FLAO|nr:translational GTPase TypA [Polaribacter aquimarinus]PWG05039.1 translational GTPase TypA [Polaribacter aquimarinus]
MQSIRNIAIIAHVDHGKTTLVDKIIDQAKILDDRKERTDLLLDNNDLERERGITILSKNVSVNYKDVKINVIDTPGHADFGGEVERVLKMADGVLLLVDAFEGPMPQTRFVLGKAIELGLTPIVVVNKVDKENCTPDLVHEKVFDLMFALEATEEQLDFTTIYGSAKNGWMSEDWEAPTDNIIPLLDAVLESIPEAPYREGSPQMQITSLDFSSFTGRIAIGRVYRGDLEENKDYMLCKADGSTRKVRIKELHIFEGMGKAKVAKVRSGDICAITGIDGFEIGDTIADLENPEALPRIEVDQPTMSMLFTINNSPFFGKEGKFVTSRHLRDRLFKEMEKNLALRVDTTDSEDKFNVFGRGVLHLSVLIETMRREGYELQVGRPQVIIKEIDGVKSEPYETLSIDVPEDVASKAINLVSLRKGDLLVMEPKGDLQHLEFTIPSRGLIGLRNKILTATAGTAIINHRFSEYGPFKGEFTEDIKGAIVSSAAGKATAYAIDRLQDRGRFFIDPNEDIYIGQVVGENSKDTDMGVNLIKGKKLTNVRSSGTDDSVKIAPKIDFSLEECMEYIKVDEYLEVTPASLRMRKINFRP